MSCNVKHTYFKQTCGKNPLKKSWDKSKTLRIIKPSKYQQNEPSVKMYWRNAVKDIELMFKDDKFWDTQTDTVRELLKPHIFERIAKIFNLPLTSKAYEPPSEDASVISSNQFYKRFSDVARSRGQSMTSESAPSMAGLSGQDVEEEEEVEHEEEEEEEEQSHWSSSDEEDLVLSRSTAVTNKSMIMSKSKHGFSTSGITIQRSMSTKLMSRTRISQSLDTLASTYDDLDVHHGSHLKPPVRDLKTENPFFHMLYCNESETDMIKWPSNYKEKKIEVSASDEFSKKAELLSKKIAIDFYEWWTRLGTLEHKTEITSPEVIEELFQVWFDEHASRSLKLDPKLLPCVLPSIAKYCGAPQASCPALLKRHIDADIKAETSPAHTRAFNSSLPLKLRHMPPRNNTKEVWHCLKIPQDLKTMSAVWEDIAHLTSTKAFRNYLSSRPQLTMPLCFATKAHKKKQLFVVPSDYVLVRPVKSSDEIASQTDLKIPISKFNMEVKEVLSKLLTD